MVVWSAISKKQNLSTDFLIEFQDEINWPAYFYSQQAEYNIMKSFILKTEYTDIKFIKTNYLTNNQKKSIQKMLDLKHLFSIESTKNIQSS